MRWKHGTIREEVSKVVIAVLDDAVQADHPDLQPNYLRGRDVIDGDDDPSPEFASERHGTAVAGVVAARGDNQLGVSGSCPRCSLLAVRMLGGSESDHAEAFDWAVEQGAHIITNSWGYAINTQHTEDVEDAIENAIQNGRGGLGCVVLFAMTNTNVDNCIGSNPDISSLPGVIAVSRSTNLDQLGSGGFGNCMSLIAPTRGGTRGITTTDRTGAAGYGSGDYHNNFGGTSSATPLVAGIGGLLLNLNCGLTSQDVQGILEHTADKIDASNANYDSIGFSHTHGFGRANAYRAVVPTVSVRVSPKSVAVGQPFSVTVTASAPYGVQSLSWSGQSTGIASVDAPHERVFSGPAIASHTWNGLTASTAGTFTIAANATDCRFPMPGDGYPHQAADGSGLATATLIVSAGHLGRIADDDATMPATKIPNGASHEDTKIPRIYVVNQNCYDLYDKLYREIFFDDPKAIVIKSDAKYLSQDENFYYFSSSKVLGTQREWAFSVEPTDAFRGHQVYYRNVGETNWRLRDGQTIMSQLSDEVTADFSIDHLEITQGLQDSSNSIPLVKGKPTVVRAFPKVATGASISGVSARLRASRAGAELPGSPITPDNGPIDVDTSSADRHLVDDSLNFTLDPDWYDSDTTLSVELILPNGVSDPDLSNNREAVNAEYVARRGLAIRYVLVEYNNANWTGQRQPRNRVADQVACDFLRSIYPADPNSITYDPWSPVNFTFGQGDANGRLNGDALITELNTLYAASPAPPDRLYAWTPENAFASNGLSDPLWAGGQNQVAFGNDTGSETHPPTNSRWRRTFAHEIGTQHQRQWFGSYQSASSRSRVRLRCDAG